MMMARRFTKQLTLPRNTEVMIHIGKCGGSTLRNALKNRPEQGKLHVVHVQKPPIRSDLKYHIVARGPVSRVLSAFNWRYKLVVEEEWQKTRFAGEYEVLKAYGTLNDLAGALYDTDGQGNPSAQADFRKIHHLKQDIAFYLGDLLPRISPDQVASLLMQENLSEDLERVFGFKDATPRKTNRPGTDPVRMHLGERERANLVRFLERDFTCLQTLYCWGKLSKSTFVAALG